MKIAMEIRPERPEDVASVHRVNELAFGTPAEADLVDALRRAADPFVSLVAVIDDRIVGHILFTPVSVEGAADRLMMGLAPMAVLPEYQNQGIGSRLVEEGLQACARLGAGAVAVLGHPEYYPRFGFEPAAKHGLRSEYDVPDEVFMVQELEPGALSGCRGLIRYRPEFAAV